MIITPLLNKVKKGTQITFQSVGEDMSFTNGSSLKQFKFSKFVLLDIPPIVTSTDNQNTVQFANIEGTFMNGLSTASPPPNGDIIDFSESLQNYLLNMETLLLKSADYDYNSDLTVAERVFFKWLKEIGAIRFAENTIDKSSTLTDKRFVEEDDNDDINVKDLYSKVIKYIGDIDIEGNHRSNTNAFKEVYIYVPTDHGNTPKILFKNTEDKNYKSGMSIKRLVDPEFIDGRNNVGPTSVGLSTKAFYDMDINSPSITYNINGGNPLWFDYIKSNGPNSYFTEQQFDDSTNDEITRTNTITSNTIYYKRSRLDGIGIDFDTKNYKYFENNPDKSSFGEFNNSTSSDSFKFNTIALYYDVLDKDGNILATNLYGVLFIDDIEPVSTGGSKIKSYNKIKPNQILADQGNGYGIKFNLKTDFNSDQPTPEIEVSVNEYNTFSMFLFTETMQKISLMNLNFEKAIIQNMEIFQKLNDLESIILNSDNVDSINMELESIKEKLTDVVPNSNLLDIINKNTDKINDILKGSTTVGLSFFLDIITSGGIKTVLQNNQLNISNTRQKYSFLKEISLSGSISNNIGYNNILTLDQFDTLYYHNADNIIAVNDIHIFIDDSLNNWKYGQCLELSINKPIDFNNYGIIIYTDSLNRFNLSDKYQKLIGVIQNNEIKKDKFSIEIICIDETKYDFLINIK